MITHTRKNAVALILVIATILTLTVTPTVLADTNTDWEPPENEHNLPPLDHALMWSLDEDPDNASNDTVTNETLAQSIDYTYNTPQTHPEQWNDGDIKQFSTSRYDSVHPPGTDTSDNGFIKDAYIATAAITPSTIYHETPDSTLHITPQNGNVYTITDYRVDVPHGSQTDDRIVEYSLKNTEITSTQLTPDTGTGDKHTRNKHTSKLSYSNLNSGDTTLTARATIKTRISKVVQENKTRKKETCTTDDDGNKHCSTKTVSEWVTTTDKTLTSEHTVSNSTSVHAYEPTMTVQYQYLPDGSVVAKYELPKYWTAVTTPGGNTIDSPIDTYTQRDTKWDTLVEENSIGTSEEYRSPVNPVETHAFPSEQQATFRTNFTAYTDSTFTIRSQSGSQKQSPSLPDTINLNVAQGSGTWTNPKQLTLHASKGFNTPRNEPHTFTIHSVSAGASKTITGQRLKPPTQTNLTVSVIDKNTSRKTATVQLSLTENKTGNPIQTAGNNGFIRFSHSDEKLETNADGIVKTTVNYRTGTTILRGSYNPQVTFETVDPYDSATDTATIRSKISKPTTAFEFVKPLLAYVSILLMAYYAIYSMMPHRLPWPPWKPD